MAAVLLSLGLALRHGLTEKVVQHATRLPWIGERSRDRWIQSSVRVDDELRALGSLRPRDLGEALAWLVLSRLLQIGEVCILLQPLMARTSPDELLLVAVIVHPTIQILTWLGAIVPGRVGVLEGGVALLFSALMFDPAVGVAMQLLRRIRGIATIGVGLLLGAVMTGRESRRCDVV
jgi:uncharacterized membrane protein YbhN (UPF0104 family)